MELLRKEKADGEVLDVQGFWRKKIVQSLARGSKQPLVLYLISILL